MTHWLTNQTEKVNDELFWVLRLSLDSGVIVNTESESESQLLL